MEMVVIIHGGATPIVLKNDVFKDKYQVENPNMKIIKDLKRTGVKVYVCGQALADNKFESAWVNPGITVVLSALVFVPTYELKGYAYVPFI
jgi:intracellular sulfur oxidation DsrE/DsrF family protein